MTLRRQLSGALAAVACAAVVGPAAALAGISPGRPPDVGDAAAAAPVVLSHGTSPQSASPARPPDVNDAAEAARWASPDAPSGFGWWDYAAGMGSGIGLGGLAIGFVAIRRRVLSVRRLQTA